jgi:hypothetical protein
MRTLIAAVSVLLLAGARCEDQAPRLPMTVLP